MAGLRAMAWASHIDSGTDIGQLPERPGIDAPFARAGRPTFQTPGAKIGRIAVLRRSGLPPELLFTCPYGHIGFAKAMYCGDGEMSAKLIRLISPITFAPIYSIRLRDPRFHGQILIQIGDIPPRVSASFDKDKPIIRCRSEIVTKTKQFCPGRPSVLDRVVRPNIPG
jgi:hypothetical protein